MKAVEIVLILAWLVLGSDVQAHKVHKRILVNSNSGNDTANYTTPIGEKLNETKGNVSVEVRNIVDHSDTSTPNPTRNTTLTNVESALKAKPTNTSSSTDKKDEEQARIELTIDSAKQSSEQFMGHPNQTYVFSVVIVPSIIPTDNEVHAEHVPDEVAVMNVNNSSSLKVETSVPSAGNISLSGKIMPQNSVVDFGLDLSKFLGTTPVIRKESRKFENATTSIVSEIESEMGLVFEFTPTNTSAEKAEEPSLPYNKTDTSKTLIQIDDVPFVEDFSPFFPLESFFGNLLLPQETIIIETDSEHQNPANYFPFSFFSNNSQLLKKLDRDVLDLPGN